MPKVHSGANLHLQDAGRTLRYPCKPLHSYCRYLPGSNVHCHNLGLRNGEWTKSSICSPQNHAIDMQKYVGKNSAVVNMIHHTPWCWLHTSSHDNSWNVVSIPPDYENTNYARPIKKILNVQFLDTKTIFSGWPSLLDKSTILPRNWNTK